MSTCPVLVIECIAVRQVSEPPNRRLKYVATITVEDDTANAYVTGAVRMVRDPFVGQTLSFRDHFEIPVRTSAMDVRRSISISIASECGTVSFGSAFCHESREWTALSKPRGEVQAVFAVIWPEQQSSLFASGSSLSKDAPGVISRVRPHSALVRGRFVNQHGSSSSSPARAEAPSTEAAGSLVGVVVSTVRFLNIGIQGVNHSYDPTPLFLSLRFAQQEKCTSVVESSPAPAGHFAHWKDVITFDVPSYITDRTATARLWMGQSKSDATFLGEVGVGVFASSTNVDDVALPLPGMPRGKVLMTVQTVARHSMAAALTESGEKSSGSSLGTKLVRPASAACSRKVDPLVPKDLCSTHDAGGVPPLASRPVLQPRHGRHPGSKRNSKGADVPSEGSSDEEEAPKAAADSAASSGSNTGAPDDVQFQGELLRATKFVEERLGLILAAAFTPVSQRVHMLERRIATVEDRVYRTLYASAASSRPSSAETAKSVSASRLEDSAFASPCVTQDQLRARFQEYDTDGVGYIDKSQLIHFYRTSYSLACDESDDFIENEVRKYAVHLDSGRVTFDEFCGVALNLAKR